MIYQSIKPKHNIIRALPYPFKGAVSISNDVEFFEFAFFDQLFSFLNSRKETKLGRGLGLEVTSSIFFYSANEYSFSYFSGHDWMAKPDKYAPRIVEYMKSGWIDTNHAYGDFDFHGGFSRNHAESCYEEMEKIGVNIRVFTNHGGVENIQNVGADAEYHLGDIKGDAAYHADLLKTHGVKYLWTDSLINNDTAHKKKAVIAPELPAAEKKWKDVIGGLLRKRHSPVLDHALAKHQDENNNYSLLVTCKLQDESEFTGFRRHRATGNNAPNLSSFGHQLSLIPWGDFYRDHGAVIIYQHLGIGHRINRQCYGATIDTILATPEMYLAPFYYLQRESMEGRLWVCGLYRMLNYLNMIEHLSVHLDNSGAYVIETDMQVTEDLPDVFAGLTLYVDPLKPARVIYKGADLPLRVNGPDETGSYSVTVPMRKMVDIW